jgi:transposase InsO family protein
VGVNRVARLMRHHGIQGRHKRRVPRTTDSKHSLPLALNLLDRQFTAPAPNRVWLADITYRHRWRSGRLRGECGEAGYPRRRERTLGEPCCEAVEVDRGCGGKVL